MSSLAQNTALTRRSPWITLTCLFWLLLALLFFVVIDPALYQLPFGTDHAWVSAHFATIARTFAEHGVLALHGIPIQNNDLLSGRPDVYLHWPPLFAILLSQADALFGATDNTAYGTMFAIMVANALLLFLLARRLAGVEAGLLTAFAWFTLPINIKFGYLVVHLSFALTLVLLALLFLVRRIQNAGSPIVNTVCGCCAIAIATLTTWEPVLMVGGLWLAAWLTNARQLRLTLTAYVITAGAVAAGVLIWYGVMYPDLARDIFHAALHRAGLSGQEFRSDDMYSLGQRHEGITSLRYQVMVFVERFQLLGTVGTVAVAALWLDALLDREQRDLGVWVTTVGLSALWLLWAVAMRQHYAVHSYETLSAAPLIALASGLFLWRLLTHVEAWPQGPQRRIALILVLGAIPLAMALDLSQGARMRVAQAADTPASHHVRYGKAINEHTAHGDIVIATSPNMVPVYYSRRHVIRGIGDEQLLTRALAEVSRRSGARSIYLAIEPEYLAAFPDTVQKLQPVFKDEDLVLFELTRADAGAGANTKKAD